MNNLFWDEHSEVTHPDFRAPRIDGWIHYSNSSALTAEEAIEQHRPTIFTIRAESFEPGAGIHFAMYKKVGQP